MEDKKTLETRFYRIRYDMTPEESGLLAELLRSLVSDEFERFYEFAVIYFKKIEDSPFPVNYNKRIDALIREFEKEEE